MDKTKKMSRLCAMIALVLCMALAGRAQQVSKVEFCGKSFVGTDSIALHLKLLDSMGKSMRDLSEEEVKTYLRLRENSLTEEIDMNRVSIRRANGQGGGQRISENYTFSVLVDRNIADKEAIYQAVGELVKAAPDSCVYLSFFGDNVTSSQLVTTGNYASMHDLFMEGSTSKYFGSALYAKMSEFVNASNNMSLMLASDYQPNAAIARRAAQNADRNILFVFVDGTEEASYEDVDDITITDFQAAHVHDPAMPRVYAFYYTASASEANQSMREVLGYVVEPLVDGRVLTNLKGELFMTTDMNQALQRFQQAVNDAAYDYDFVYQAVDVYQGQPVHFAALWNDQPIGETDMTIGTEENPFPASGDNPVMKYLMALLVAILTFAFFFIVVKILIPATKSKSFALKYYKSYVPEAGINRRICYYCGQDIRPGQRVVTKCKHMMHVPCWQQNGFKCSEFGQSCKTGTQPHIDWNMMFSRDSMRECRQTLSGIVAALLSWIVYELTGRGSMFHSLASKLTSWSAAADHPLWTECVSKVSSFLAIGLLLGFFLSFLFRYSDDYRQKSARVIAKIAGLSVLSAVIGMAAFALGGLLFTVWVGSLGGNVAPWYCSLPAYLLFSIAFSLSLCIGSSIPMKSALLGGVISAVIGFIVLYFSGTLASTNGWINMLLNFIIYGGGLGASLATVRMMAERYFLVIQNGSRQGIEIPIHKWMNSTGGGRVVTLGMTGDCEIQMNWDRSNNVAKEHAQLYIDHERSLPILKPLASGVTFNQRTELLANKEQVLTGGDTFKIGETIFMYIEKD
ncbi:MAG: hypothetical protein IJ160_05000 [Muribaculaceae bacterium]|nr:hypothetical protein [Muribaculaceae bacterium]